MYVRFILDTDHAEAGVRVGPFEVAYRLRREAGRSMCDVDWLVLDDTLDWFDDELRVPHRFDTWYRGWKDGYCWFRDTARDHIAQMRVLGDVLGRCGFPVTKVWGRAPGRIVYGDEHQVVAVPYRDTWVG